MPMPVIKFTNVSKDFYLQEDKTFKELIPSLILGKAWAKKLRVFSDLNFAITKGETVAIVGKNGAGKSTIMKLIAGVTYPTKGKILVKEKVAPLIELGAGFHHELTGYENIFLNAAILGMHKKEIELILEDIIEFSELGDFINIPIKRYSTGMMMRLAFSIAIHSIAPILLIDEVLAVGDAAFAKKCLQRMQEFKKDKKKTIIFVSHSQKDVEFLCERAILLQEGKITIDSTPKKVFAKYQQDENI